MYSSKNNTKCLLLLVLILCSLNLYAQEDSKHYLPPTFSTYTSQQQEFVRVVLTTNSTTAFNVNYKYADGTTGKVVGLSKATPKIIELQSKNEPTPRPNYDGMVINSDNRINQVLRNEGLILESEGGKLFFVNVMFKVPNQADVISSKGTTGLGTEFFSGHLVAVKSQKDYRSHFISVMATEDNTVVTFDNPRVRWKGQPTHTFNVTLNKGESYVLAAPHDYISATYPVSPPTIFNDYNGTHITTNGKNIAVNCGSFTSSGVDDDGQDAGADQVVPIEYTGQEYIAVEGNGVDNSRNGSPGNEIVTMVGTVDNTTVSVNGIYLTTIDKGEYCIIPESHYVNKVMYIKTSQNAYAYQTLSGSTENCTSGLVFLPRLSDSSAKAVSISGVNDVGAISLYITSKAGAVVKINNHVVPQSNAIAIQGKSDWVAYRLMTNDLNTAYCASGNTCADLGSSSIFYIESTSAMNAAVSVVDRYVGGAAYYSGFAMPNAKAGIWKLGITEYTLACNKAVELLASGAIEYRWSGNAAAMALITPKPNAGDSIKIFTPNSSAGVGPFVYNVEMEVKNPLSALTEIQKATLTVYVKPLPNTSVLLDACVGTPIALNGPATPISTKNSYVTGVNMGGPTYVDANGYAYSSGTSYNKGGQAISIANTSDQVLYQSETWNNGPMNFTYSLPNGTYTVKLMWAETYFDQAGKRKFNVNIQNGGFIKDDLDVFAEAGGKARAYNIEQSISVTNGVLNVDLTKGSVDNPMINAIVITKQLADVPSNGFYNWTTATNLNYTIVESPLFTPVKAEVITYKLSYDDGVCDFTKDVTVTVKEDCTESCKITASINGASSALVDKGTDVNLASSSTSTTSTFTFLEWRKIIGTTETVVSTTNANPIVRADEKATYRVSYVNPDNLVVNGDFEQGANVGFTVDPSYKYTPPAILGHYSSWSIGDGLEWSSIYFKAPTGVGGNGKIFYMDGGSVKNVAIYQTNVSVVKDKEYVFEAYVANIYNGQYPGGVPPELRFQIDGENLDYITGLTTDKQEWVRFYTTWKAKSTGIVSIKLLNNSIAPNGNDFAIDNIRFSPICTENVELDVKTPSFTVDAGVDVEICAGDVFTRTATVDPLGQGEFVGWYEVGANSKETLLATQPETLSTTPTSTTTYRVKYSNKTYILNEDFSGPPPTTECTLTLPASVTDVGFFNSQTSTPKDGIYIITSNPFSEPTPGVSWATNMTDHTGGGNMMFVNGGSLTTTKVYSATVNVIAGHDYILSVYAATPLPDTDLRDKAELIFEIHNSGPKVDLGKIDLNSPPPFSKWIQFKSDLYRATTTGTIDIVIRNDQTAALGNDFALDDITFSEIVTDDVTIKVNPKPGVDIGINRSICEGESIQIKNISQVDSYQWSKDGLPVSADFQIVVNNDGEYRLDATSSKGCKDWSQILVTQVASPKFDVVDGSACIGTPITVKIKTPDPNFNYQWYAKDDVYFQTPLETVSSYAAPTNGYYILKVTEKASGFNCSSIKTATASYNLRPALVFDYAKKDLCLHDAPMEIKLSDSYNLGGTLSYPVGKGVSETASGVYQFTPNSPDAVVGDNKLKFTWSDGTCSMDTIITLVVHDIAPPTVYDGVTTNQVNTLTDNIDKTPYKYFHGVATSAENTITWLNSTGGIVRTDITEGDFFGDVTGATNNTQKYSVYQTDGFYGCKSAAVNLTYNFVVCDGTLSGTAGSVPVCYGDKGTVTLNAEFGNGTYSYTFDGVEQASATFNDISPKTTVYNWVIKDKHKCSVSGTHLVTQSSQIDTTSVTTTPNISCSDIIHNGTASIIAFGGSGSYTYLWNNNSALTAPNATGLAASATHSVVVTDSKNCKRTFDKITVTDKLVYPSVTPSVSTPIECYGGLGAVTLTVTNNTSAQYDYTFNSKTNSGVNSQSSTFTGVTKGTDYTWSVVDLNSCKQSGTYTVSEPTQIQATLSQTSNTKCSGTPNGTASVVASGGPETTYTYLWSTTPTSQTTATASNLAEGNYTVKVTSKSCTESFNVAVVNEFVYPSVTPSISTPIDCYGGVGAVTLAVTNKTSGSYDFTFGSITNSSVPSQSSVFVSVASGSGYVWKVKDLNDCTTSGIFDVTSPSLVIATLNQTPNTQCSGTPNGTATVVVSGGVEPYTYQWSSNSKDNTSATTTELSANSYQVTVADGNKCTSSYTVSVTDNLSYPTTTIATPFVLTCSQTSIRLDGSSSSNGNNYRYEWNGPGGVMNFADRSILEITEPGDYTLTVINSESNCTNNAMVKVMQSNTLPIVNAGLDQEICIYGGGAKLETVVNSTALISNIEWSPNNSLIGYNSQNPTANPLQSTLYIAKVTDENGCVGVDSVMVNVKSFEECYNIIIPPIFTPNGDGYNDYWVIEGMDQFPQSKIQIFDRFGQLMHVYLKSEGDWNGYSFGKLVASDSYWYVVDVVPVGVTLKGHVSVKR